MNNQKKLGAIFSYILIVVNTLYGLFFTPFMIRVLGEGEYGVYQIINSLVGSITILDLGIGSTMLRYIANFYALKDKIKISNFSAMGFIQAAVLSCIMLVVCSFIYFSIDGIYGDALSVSELNKAKTLFVLFVIVLVIGTFEKVVFGIIAGCERFAFANGLKVVSLFFKIMMGYLVLNHNPNSVYLVILNIIISLIIIFIQILYILCKLKIKIRLFYWDTSLFKQSFIYTLLVFIQSIAVQFNGNLDNMVIGACLGASMVSLYSISLRLYNMYEQFALAFSDLMLPTVSKQIYEGASSSELENTVIRVGRLEFIVLGGALGAFVVIGKEFITLWLGPNFIDAWGYSLILMIPTTIPLIQNVCLSILRAKNKMGFRTIVVSVMALFNFIITVFGVPRYGAVAACVGTAIGLIGANVIAMNVYYVKVIGLNIRRIFQEILSKTWICCLITFVVVKIIDTFIYGNWILWLSKGFIYCIVYLSLLFILGFNETEKIVLKGMLCKFVRGGKK